MFKVQFGCVTIHNYCCGFIYFRGLRKKIHVSWKLNFIVSPFFGYKKTEIRIWRASLALYTNYFLMSSKIPNLLWPTGVECDRLGLDELSCDVDVIGWECTVAQLWHQCYCLRIDVFQSNFKLALITKRLY